MDSHTVSQPAGSAGQSPGRPLLQVQNISKRYGSVRALRDVSFDLRQGEIHGLCGHNGAGKSTLVKIITGLVEPDTGTIEIEGEPVSLRTPLQAQAHGIALVDQELSLAPDLSVEENIFLGTLGMPFLRRPREVQQRARALLARVGLGEIDPRTPLERLSIGERQLVEVARMLGRDAKVLILDEPTATLSESEIERVFAVARAVVRENKGAIYISHRLDEVLDLCDRVTVFRDGQLVATRSSHEIGHRQELIRMMIGVELPPPTESTAAEVHQSRGIEIRDLEVPPIVSGFELSVAAGQIVGLTGQVGAGTSEVLRALAGLVSDARGTLTVDGAPVLLGSPTGSLRAGIGFASNDRKTEGLFLRQTVRTNLVATRLGQVSRLGFVRGRLLAQTAARLASFVKVDAARVGSRAETLSGGNQQKVFLGRCLDRGDVKLLLLDEPTRGVDAAGRAEVHQLIREAALAGVTVVFASTELDEILELAQTVVTMFAGRIVATRPRSDVTAAVISADMTMSRERLSQRRADGLAVSGNPSAEDAC
jgi:ABC-type sugar transport system ATPase subunit